MSRSVEYIIELKDRVSANLARINKAFQRTEQSGTKAAKNIDSSWSTLSRVIGGAAIAAFGKFAYESTSALERTQVEFAKLTKSAELGQKTFDDLTELANKTPLDNKDVNQAARTLLAFGLDASKVTETIRNLGDVALGDAERLKSLSLAFGQVRSAGKLTGQDLLQFINAGFNPLEVISRKTGKSMLELKEAMSKGQISFKAVNEAFKIATSRGGRYSNTMEEIAKTMSGKVSTVMGKFRLLVGQVGLTFQSSVGGMLDKLITFLDFLSRHQKVIVVFTSAIMGLSAALGAAYLVKSIRSAVVALNALRLAMLANPVTAIAVAITTLVAALAAAYTQSEKVRKVMNGLWDAMVVVKTIAGEMLTDAIQNIKSFAQAIALLKAGAYETAGNILFSKKDEKEEVSRIQRIIDAYRKAGSENRFAKPSEGFGAEREYTGPGIELGSADANSKAKRTGESIVRSGGIKTFNLNINQVVGIENMQTSGISQTADNVGDAVQAAIMGALADVVPQ